MKIEVLGAKAPVWGDEAKTVINLKVKFSHLPDLWVDFTATHNDSADHGRELFSRAKFGEYGPVDPYTGPSKADLEMGSFQRQRAQAASTVEAQIAPLERAKRLGVATPQEEAELEQLERYSVYLMRAKGPELVAMSDI